MTTEALGFDQSLLSLPIEGTRSDGAHATAMVFVPQPFTFLLMKLHAFADRLSDSTRDLGRHHALDVYRIVAMLTPEEYDAIRENVRRHSRSAAVQRAGQIVAEHFSSMSALGALRLREHALFTASMDVHAMLSALADLFPQPPPLVTSFGDLDYHELQHDATDTNTAIITTITTITTIANADTSNNSLPLVSIWAKRFPRGRA